MTLREQLGKYEDISIEESVNRNTIKPFFMLSAILFFMFMFLSFVFYPATYDTTIGISQLGFASVSGNDNVMSRVLFVMMVFSEATLFLALFIVSRKSDILLAVLSLINAFSYILMALPNDIYNNVNGFGGNLIAVVTTIMLIYVILNYKLSNSYIFIPLIAINYIIAMLSKLGYIPSLVDYEDIFFYAMNILLIIISVIPEKRKTI